jgi:hypothetical protein
VQAETVTGIHHVSFVECCRVVNAIKKKSGKFNWRPHGESMICHGLAAKNNIERKANPLLEIFLASKKRKGKVRIPP